MRSRRSFLRFTAFSTAFTVGIRAAWSKTFRLQSTTWLEVRKTTGRVVYQRGRIRQLAWNGLRLKRVGEILESYENSSAVLALDQGIGTVHVGENTRFYLKTLKTTPEGGRVTQLEVTWGQVRLKVRPMTNPTSRLEIYTPAGISGVRGTEFGVSVQPSGKMGIATITGRVDAIAQEKSVSVGQQFQNLTMPQQPPQASVPLRDDPGLSMTEARLEAGNIRISGQTDAVNVVLVDGQPQNTDQDGNFDLLMSLNHATSIEMRVITPLGTQKRYDIPIYEG